MEGELGQVKGLEREIGYGRVDFYSVHGCVGQPGAADGGRSAVVQISAVTLDLFKVTVSFVYSTGARNPCHFSDSLATVVLERCFFICYLTIRINAR